MNKSGEEKKKEREKVRMSWANTKERINEYKYTHQEERREKKIGEKKKKRSRKKVRENNKRN